ncbi:MAG: hypothetical protein H6656_11005 [Ardenticatenaceae bacterium]|nr:hypothetical protein [Ardenticatenaceae bacterium]
MTIDAAALRAFLALAQTYIEATLQANLRPDGLTHTYNILRLATKPPPLSIFT